MLLFSEISNRFPPLLRSNFENILRTGKIGLAQFTSKDILFVKSFKSKDENYFYYYTIKIPYGGRKLIWDIIFYPENLHFVPDFHFNDEGFYLCKDIVHVMNHVPSLLRWDVSNPSSLLTVIKEWLYLYQLQYIQMLETENVCASIHREYDDFVRNFPPLDVELSITNLAVTLVVCLRLNTQYAPNYVQEVPDMIYNPGEDNCILKFVFTKFSSQEVTVSAHLSPRVGQLLKDLKLLPYRPPLACYISDFQTLLEGEMIIFQESYEAKRSFIVFLIAKYGLNVVEYDSQYFSSASLLMSVEDYYFLLIFKLGTKFPHEQPIVTRQSIYCFNEDPPCQEVFKQYPYNSKWTEEAILDRIMGAVLESTTTFQSHCH